MIMIKLLRDIMPLAGTIKLTIFHLCFAVILIEGVFTQSISRIITTLDIPGYFTIPTRNSTTDELFSNISYDTKHSLDFGYEHKILDGGDIVLFAGGEFMLGRMSDENLSVHSLYLKGGLQLTEKSLLFGKLGGNRHGCDFHGLRHALATLDLVAGINPKMVSEALGHSNISITLDLYSPVLPNMQDELAGAIANILKR